MPAAGRKGVEYRLPSDPVRTPGLPSCFFQFGEIRRQTRKRGSQSQSVSAFRSRVSPPRPPGGFLCYRFLSSDLAGTESLGASVFRKIRSCAPAGSQRCFQDRGESRGPGACREDVPRRRGELPLSACPAIWHRKRTDEEMSGSSLPARGRPPVCQRLKKERFSPPQSDSLLSSESSGGGKRPRGMEMTWKADRN